MSNLAVIIERNQRRFDQTINAIELNLLNREKLHLIRKASQRQLNNWEQERLKYLEQELEKIIAGVDGYQQNIAAK